MMHECCMMLDIFITQADWLLVHEVLDDACLFLMKRVDFYGAR